MKTILQAVACWVLVSSVALAQQWADLTGRFVYDGTPPKPRPLKITKDVNVFGDKMLVDESLVVGPDGGLANVVIYLTKPRKVQIHPDLKNEVPKEVVVDNKDGRFVPRVATVWIGAQKLVYKNSDPVSHNCNCQPFNDTPANPLLPPGQSFEHMLSFSQFVPVPVTCNIHPWMKGYVLPRSNPYMAVSDKEGRFTIKKLPAGVELEFRLWQEKSGYLKDVEVAGRKAKRGRFKITLKPGKNDLGEIRVPADLFK